MTTATIPSPTTAPATLPLAPAHRPGKKRLIGLAVGLAVAAIAITVGANWWRDGRFIETTDDAYVGADITVVTAKVPGYITRVLVTDNQQVVAGQVLAQLDDRDYRAALARADGAVAAAQALIANLDATRSLQAAVIGQAQAGLGASTAESDRARDDQQRYARLSSKEAVSVQSAQQANAAYKQAVAGDRKSAAQLLAAERELDVIKTRRAQAEAALAQSVAERDIATLNLGYTVLRAPLAGTIGNRRARAGAFAAAGSSLLSVVPAQGLWIDANFKEGQLGRMAPGQRASIVADVMPGHVFHGTVASLAPATGAQFSILPPENATGNFTKIVQRVPVRIVLDAQDATLGVLRPGLSVAADIDVRSAPAAPR